MRNIFNSVRLKSVKRNKFPLSFVNDFTTEYGNICPVAVYDVHSGEIFKISIESFIRTQPLRAPAFTSSDVSYHCFFVPNRLIYKNWTKFIVRGTDGDTDYVKPFATYMDFVGSTEPPFITQFVTFGSLMDFLNFPTFNDPDTLTSDISDAVAASVPDDPGYFPYPIDMMPFNAYNLIWNEYYRDENLQPEIFIWDNEGYMENYEAFQDYQSEVSEDFGLDAMIFVWPFHLRRRNWRKDYFTSALPFIQKGSPISLMGTVNPVDGTNVVNVKFFDSTGTITSVENWFMGLHNPNPGFANMFLEPFAFVRDSLEQGEGLHSHQAVTPDSTGVRTLVPYIELPELQSTVMTISDLRIGLALQQWFELNARTGSDRYFEYLLGHFGVRDRDSRMQRPEYLGGYSHAIQISEVEQTSSTDSVTPQGNLAGRGLGYAHNRPIKYRCPEHGFIMILQSIRPRTAYFQGWPRMYQRWDAFDYYDPLFDHLSEQAIKTSELYWQPGVPPLTQYDLDFGYTPRYSEFRSRNNEIHGDFRSTLKYWASPRTFDSVPKLDSNFIEINPYKQHLYDMFAYPGTEESPAPHFICHVAIHCSAIRPMSKFATPGL